MKFFKNIKKTHLRQDPFEHIYCKQIIKIDTYDRLYELQNTFDHEYWKDFIKEYNLNCNFLEDIRDIDLSKQIIALWFFVERADRDKKTDIELYYKNESDNKLFQNWKSKLLVYYPNTFLMFKQTKESCIKILERKNKNFYIRRPCIQINYDLNTYNNLIEILK